MCENATSLVSAVKQSRSEAELEETRRGTLPLRNSSETSRKEIQEKVGEHWKEQNLRNKPNKRSARLVH